jgi:hypothetical protein
MVHLTEADSEFAARVLVAKLGSAGILAEVRGICSPYPNLGTAQVFVEESEFVDARELISADLDDGFSVDEPRWADHHVRPVRSLARPVMVATALLLLGSFALPRCGPPPAVRSH